MKVNIINVTTVLDYIEENLSNKLDLEIIANGVHYSKYHLHRIFVDTIGLTIHEYVQRRRLTEAAKLLVFSNRPIIEIALISGYESQQAFTTIFKLMYKKSPHQYRQAEEFYPLQLRYILNKQPTKISSEINYKKDIDFAKEDDISAWMELLYLVVDGFPYLNEEQYLKQLQKSIQRREALIIRDQNVIIGAMAFNKQIGSIEFLGIHPQYRKHNIANVFLQRMWSELSVDIPISVTTFRKGDKADIGYREVFQSLGFTEAELLIEYGYPTQRLILKKGNFEVSSHG